MAVVPARTSRPDLGVPFAPEPRVAASGTLFSASEAPSSPAEVVSAHAREQTRCRSVVDRAMASCKTGACPCFACTGRAGERRCRNLASAGQPRASPSAHPPYPL